MNHSNIAKKLTVLYRLGLLKIYFPNSILSNLIVFSEQPTKVRKRKNLYIWLQQQFKEFTVCLFLISFLWNHIQGGSTEVKAVLHPNIKLLKVQKPSKALLDGDFWVLRPHLGAESRYIDLSISILKSPGVCLSVRQHFLRSGSVPPLI